MLLKSNETELIYIQVNIDDCYAEKNRTEAGDIVEGMLTTSRVLQVFLCCWSDAVRFSRGMRNLTDTIHALGFKTGIVSTHVFTKRCKR